MSVVKWTPVALAELEDILFQIAVRDRRPETAEKIYLEVRTCIEHYANENIPEHAHPALPEGWLYWMHKRWMIAYELTPETVVVHRIVDASRDLPKVF